ncbi:hypothetical protein [Nostocoides sp. HKS02]|uniref:hypothetical protein n=1 Tax=Nostocoides sp. HKS02 TaxID=1813880 RepID=UPI00351B7437
MMALRDGSWVGAALGLTFGLGVVATYAGSPRRRRATLGDRLHPYLRDAPRPSRLLAGGTGSGGVGPWSVLGQPVVAELAARIERILGGAASVRRRLQRAGKAPDVDRFRAEQVLWGAGGTVASLVAAAAFWLSRGGSVIPR